MRTTYVTVLLMRKTYVTVLLMRKTSINNCYVHAHNLYYSSAHAQDFYKQLLLQFCACAKFFFTNDSAHAHNFCYSSADAQDLSVPKWQHLYAKYRFILTPKFTNVKDYVSHTADKTITLLALPLLFSWPTLQLCERDNPKTYDKQSEINLNVHRAAGEEKISSPQI